MLKRSISPFALLLTSVSAILGSGWLFAAYYTSELAGPSAILAWLIGGSAAIIIAFVFAELCAMLPITGSSTRIPYYTHGTLVSFLFAWIIWLTYASFASTEVQAVLQYFSYFFPSLVQSNAGLTGFGYFLATLLMLAISALNVFSLRWLLRCNNVLTLLKIAIPVIVALVILAVYFSPHQLLHPGHSSFMPYGMHGVFAAVSGGGIVFAFNGFKQACEMAGEAKKPARALPFAVIGSVIVCLIVYLLLQFAFLTSIIPSNLIHGWSHLALPGGTSPLTAVAHQGHLDILLPVLYAGAVIGPMAAALMYTSSAARSLYGMSKSHHIPPLFQRLLHGNPIVAIITNFLLGMSLFAPLPGWNSMITFLTSLIALTYGIGPICLLTLRKQLPDYQRPFKLPFVTVWATFAFYLCTLLTYWSGWAVISKLGIALVVGLLVLFIHRAFISPDERVPLNAKAALWVWPYLVGVTLISYLGDYGGGKGVIPPGWDFGVIGLFCIMIMWLALKFRLPTILTQHYMKDGDFTHQPPEQETDGTQEPAFAQHD
ncbi:amino acid permease [Coxiella burnetii]|uniref:APC family permease n=1 Tax=Coxiella burnetii TaxID=777 RepID=UPI0002FB9914|nr:APC family permease [Coxiella burnetii]AML48311.1 amino acid permease [Coxiella burnetii]AML54324.1 amino acid permease [Coxiella burnetii]ATN68288.1 amino acid permease [Coxiella burnetii]ATN70217.1 amino acid permease [Coxiella burnetii]ATN72160.1 amino acid permease [Coxiella burnetii]